MTQLIMGHGVSGCLGTSLAPKAEGESNRTTIGLTLNRRTFHASVRAENTTDTRSRP